MLAITTEMAVFKPILCTNVAFKKMSLCRLNNTENILSCLAQNKLNPNYAVEGEVFAKLSALFGLTPIYKITLQV
jgi:ATP/maltotriose-dependent transcriptional regulator MalT